VASSAAGSHSRGSSPTSAERPIVAAIASSTPPVQRDTTGERALTAIDPSASHGTLSTPPNR
jgi:hypothetical protein